MQTTETMTTVSRTPTTPTASAPDNRFAYVTPNDVFAGLKDGGSICVEEWAYGDLVAIAKRVEQKKGTLLIDMTDDGVGDATHDRVSVHPDESDRLALIARARKALDDAEAALLACGYVDLRTRYSV